MKLSLILPCLLVASCVAGPNLAASSAGPAIDRDFPDPAVIRAADGNYYAYATQSEQDGRMVNIQIARSVDLAHWTLLGDALPAKPVWASRTQDFWAPHVIAADGRYYLYYSAKPDAALSDAKRGLCLAVAIAEKPEGPFVDKGDPLLCGESFINIDPMAFDDPVSGKHLLYWGSGFGPIKVRELAADRISFRPGSTTIELVQPDPTDRPENYQRLVEGAWVMRHGGWYYLFYSGDNCCGAKAHYAVMVARSRSATGSFETLGHTKGRIGSAIVEANERWLAPGHNAIVEDRHGRTRILFHAIDRRHAATPSQNSEESRRAMLVGTITWRNGWPVVRY